MVTGGLRPAQFPGCADWGKVSFSVIILTNQNLTGVKLKNFQLKVPFFAEKVLHFRNWLFRR
jgi:hypothetical protein